MMLIRRVLMLSGLGGGAAVAYKEKKEYNTRKEVALEFVFDRPKQEIEDDENYDDFVEQQMYPKPEEVPVTIQKENEE